MSRERASNAWSVKPLASHHLSITASDGGDFSISFLDRDGDVITGPMEVDQLVIDEYMTLMFKGRHATMNRTDDYASFQLEIEEGDEPEDPPKW